ncbi:acyltransferase family protein [Lactobacillus sp. CRM56-3]|uniref:Acyltransferase family protein n=2 Tax=Secundilactobacillus folii TaxID=2678357 RepID=A0A7X2XT85_9LACO|nr:acyltransferase family protein [Secundilactobacillus folii]
MRIFFICGVLLNHTTTSSLTRMVDKNGWPYMTLISTHLMLHFTRMGFMFMTGLVLTLSYYNRNAWPTFFKKRFAGSGWPYLLWNFLLLFAMMLFSDPHLANLSVFSQTYWDAIIHGDRFYLYYILITLQLYVIFPLIVKLFKTVNHHRLILVSSFFIQMMLMFLIKYWVSRIDRSHWLWWFNNYGDNVFTYQFYFIFGAYTMLHYQEVSAWIQKHIKAIALITIGLGLGTIPYFLWYNESVLGLSEGQSVSPHQPYMLVYDTMMIILVFWLGRKYAYWRQHGIWQWAETLIKNGALISFGIYLDQELGLNILDRALMLIKAPDWAFFWALPISYLFVIGVSFIVAWFCYKVPPFGILIGRPQWHILKKNRQVAHRRQLKNETIK